MRIEANDGETVVEIERAGSDQSGDLLWSVHVDGVLSTVELLAVHRLVSQRLGENILASDVSDALRGMKVEM